MKGDLTRICLPDIIRHIYTNRRSGCLRLIQEQTRKEIFFELGAMIFASSNRREDRIGETMVRHGTLSRENFQLIQTRMGRGKRFGKVLVELGLMNERDLIANVTIQILDIVYSVFNWTTGSYEFIEIEKTVSDDLKLDLSTASIILEGVRRVGDMDIIQRGLGDLNRLIGPSTNPLLRLQSLSIKPVERQIIELAKEPVGLIQILVSVKSPAESVLRSLYGLLSAGVLARYSPPEVSRESGRFIVPEAVRQAIAKEEPAPVIIVRRHTSGNKLNETTLRTRIDLLRETIAKGDSYALFGIQPQATREELNSAYYKLAREFHPDQYQQASKELRTDVDELFVKLTRCFEALRNELQPAGTITGGTLKRTTMSSKNPINTGRLTEPVVPAVQQQKEGKSNVRHTENRPHVRLTEKQMHIPAMDELPAEIPIPVEEMIEAADEKQVEEVESESPTKEMELVQPEPAIETQPEDMITEESSLSIPLEVVVEEKKVEEKKVEEKKVEEKVEEKKVEEKRLEEKKVEEKVESVKEKVAERTEVQAAVEVLPKISSADRKRAEQLFADGRSRFQAKDLTAAARLLREAIRLDPEQTRYRLLLGHILCNNQRWHKEAEVQFRRVVEIDPYNAMAHVGLGQLYTKVGLIQRAELEFREALKLDPENVVAQKGLKSLQKEQPSAGSSTGFLSKLFSKK
jgi:Flp pilus assembly protein TadD